MNSVSLPLQHRRYLSSPCTNSLAVENISFNNKHLLLELEKFMKFFASRYKLIKSNAKVELAILSQFLYKNHNRFRNDKCQRSLKLIKKSTDRFLDELNLDKEVSKFSGVFPIAIDIKNKNKLYLPTKEMLEYIIVRFYGGANLLWKIIVYCQNAGESSVQRIRLGHFWNIGLNNLSCVSRLWGLSISMLVLVEKAYDCFLLLVPLLPANKSSIKDQDYCEFPKNIAQEITEDKCESFFQKFKNVVNNDNLPKFVSILANPLDVKQQIDLGLSIDTGEVIGREDLVEVASPATTLSPALISNSTIPVDDHIVQLPQQNDSKQLHIPCSCKKWSKLNEKISSSTQNSHALRLFVQDENKLRKTCRNTAFTKILGQAQWKVLRNDLNDCLDKLANATKDKKKQNKLLKRSKNLLMCWMLYPRLKGVKPINWKEICAHFSDKN